jgi:tRNA(Ile)-lysidine synthase
MASRLPDIVSAVKRLLARRRRVVLAVSGGVDSMVLLDAVARLRSARNHVVVAVLDHGTGPDATEGCALAAAVAASHGLRVITDRLAPGPRTEAAWRAGRWSFLRSVGARESAVIVTGHTRDDQLETVIMRLLRGASARGLAGLYAPSPVERPFLRVIRADIVRYATQRGVRYVEDPDNLSVAHLRNRVRLNILPAIRAVHPELDGQLLAIARDAARWRRAVERLADDFVLKPAPAGEFRVNVALLGGLDAGGRKVMWPALAARAGVAIDRRGLDRLTALVDAATGDRAPLSGGFEAIRGRHAITLRRARARAEPSVLLADGTEFGSFVFTAEIANSLRQTPNDPWRIWLSSDAEPVVREWVGGDRLTLNGSGSRRRVKRYFADAGIPGPLREGWPVVLVGADIVWIPGVRSTAGVPTENGESIEYRCQRRVD